MKILGVIPARYESTRFPGKPLVKIKGEPMIKMVLEQARSCDSLDQVIVATDDQRIYDYVNSIGGPAYLSKNNHKNGTERCAEMLSTFSDYDYLVNIQCDEPFITPKVIDQLTEQLNGKLQIATLVSKVSDTKQLADPDVVKVVISRAKPFLNRATNGGDEVCKPLKYSRFYQHIIGEKMEALYFSRLPIPYIRDKRPDGLTYFRHIGIYAYRTDILKEIGQLPESELEKSEQLEQLRWLENGYKINVFISSHKSVGIDSPKDLIGFN